MADKPYEPLPTKLPALDTSAARKAVKVTQVADSARSTSRADLPLPHAAKKGLKNRTVTAYAVLGCAAGIGLVLGAPLWVLAGVPLLGWAIGRRFSKQAREVLSTATALPIQTAAGLDLMKRVRSARLAIESMNLNNQIFSDLLDSIDALPERIGALESAEAQCRTLLATLPESGDLGKEQTALLARIERFGEARAEIGEVLNTLTLQAAHVTADSQMDESLERKLVLQTQALAQTAKDLS